MRAVQLMDSFGEDHLQMTTSAPLRDDGSDDDTLGAHDVRVRLRASCLNYRDLLMVRGQYNPRQPLPLVPCSDGAGEVVAVGSGVQQVQVGDRVCPTFVSGFAEGVPDAGATKRSRGGPLPGMLREEAIFDADDLVKIPSHLSFREAATLPCAALTAWTALVEEAGIRAGQTVLVLGTGGVSLFALQIAKMHGCRVVATTSSDEKAERLRSLGADAVLNYKRDESWGKTVAKTYGGADVVVEVGGAGTLQQSLAAVNTGGHVSLIGVLGGGASKVNLLPVLMRHIRVQGVFVGNKASFVRMNAALDQQQIRPVLDDDFAMEQAKDAFVHLASAQHFGKITLHVD